MKNILICVTGLTPQIVTETLYCLTVQKKKNIDELYILTTLKGKNVLTGRDKGSSKNKSSLKAEVKKLCKTYKIPVPKFEETSKYIITAQEESVELPDIRTDRHNKLFPNKVTEFIKQKTSDPNNILYCSISGGRKTMSVHLANALSLFGREEDKLLHVLTSEENEFKGYFPKTLAEDKALVLSDIPFVRLRSIITASLSKKELFKKSYIQIVKFAQDRLKVVSDTRKLILNIPAKEVMFGDLSIKLEPLQFALYFKIIEKKIDTGKSYSINEIISPRFGKEIKEFLEQQVPTYHLMEGMINPWWKKGFDAQSFRSKRSKINKQLEKLFTDKNYFGEYFISSTKIYGASLYSVNADVKKIGIIYQT